MRYEQRGDLHLGPLWLDAHLPPALAPWLRETFGIEAYSAAYLGLRDAEDAAIFAQAREAGAVIVSKDADFLERVVRLGPPPRLIYLTCGNTSKAALKILFERQFEQIAILLESGEAVVEVSG
ncbi:DUF5615 family PIN-like protein [Deinococcus radiophilus]|uniref:DUF5615 domain-containing protein n=1 Tax=Deinococcus radiophilus TaxID=32062 RepID=A0A431W688_9DEIO|nr:DUF5615 family PIN-like protein [Deinococcus radiophilus]RTR30931.1 hypothetical protein EJ104_01410 [Deinococcus radiophilus]UFA49513.1 DUF5615 family PIN-like protein [Deinococcus radiophilus]